MRNLAAAEILHVFCCSLFSLSVVKGRIPQIGEKVLVKAVYNPNQSVPWNALKVQTLSNQVLPSFVLPKGFEGRRFLGFGGVMQQNSDLIWAVK